MICFFEMSNKVLFLYFPNFHITYVKLVYHYCRNLALFIMAIFSVNHFLQPRLFFLQKIRAPRFDHENFLLKSQSLIEFRYGPCTKLFLQLHKRRNIDFLWKPILFDLPQGLQCMETKLEPSCCKKSRARNWFGEQGTSEGSE